MTIRKGQKRTISASSGLKLLYNKTFEMGKKLRSNIYSIIEMGNVKRKKERIKVENWEHA